MTPPLFRKRLSLRRKILLPFFIVLGILGLVATCGSIYLIASSFSQSSHEKLASLQDILYREVKGQENLLLTYSHILEYADAIAPQQHPDPAIQILRDQIYKSLGNAHVSLAYFPSTLQNEIPYESLRQLLAQAVRSGRPRFRFSEDMNSVPSLIVASPMGLGGPVPRIMVLQTAMDNQFLQHLTRGSNAEAALLSLDGKVLAASRGDLDVPKLRPVEMETVLEGKELLQEDVGSAKSRFRLFRAIPLGTTDMVIAVTETSTGVMGGLVATLALRSVLTLLAAVALGAFLYSRLIHQIMAPTQKLLEATRAVSGGDLDHRITTISDDELGELAESFNTMTVQLKTLHQEKIDRTRDLTQAQEELRFKEALEQKNVEVERTNRELKANVRELSALFQINQAMTSTLDVGQLFDRMSEVLREVVPFQGMALLLYHPGMEELEIRKCSGIDADLLRGGVRLDTGLVGYAARAQTVTYVPNLESDYPRFDYKGRTFPAGSMVCAPMIVKKRLAGIMILHKTDTHGFTEAEIRLIQAVTNQAAIAIDNARLYEKTRNLSNTDELTGLANRRYFHEILKRELAQARRYGSHFTLIMADIDHFKIFNDTYGHLVGDLALKKIAQVFLQNTRGIDLVARFGGEEFVILLSKTDREGALAAAEKLRHCVEETSITQPQGISTGRLTVSLGVAEFPADSREMYELLDRADRALYRAKETGRNRVVAWAEDFFSARPANPSSPGTSDHA